MGKDLFDMDTRFRTIDLCAGIGGIRRGFERTGRFENVLSAEIDKYARKTYMHIFNETDEPEHDLTTETFKQKAADRRFDVLLAGFPCQAFSRAGLKRGFEDETKGTIFHHIVEILNRAQPKALFLENVDNLLSHDKLQTFAVILRKLTDAGYKVIGLKTKDYLSPTGEFDPMLMDVKTRRTIFMRNTRDFGLPQNRPRVFIMAFRRDAFAPGAVDRLPDVMPRKREGEAIWHGLNELIESEVDYSYYIASQYLDTLERHRARHADNKERKSGFGYVVLNEGGAWKACSNTIMATGGSGKERNMIWQPNAAYAGLPPEKTGKRSPLNDKGLRFMTPTEWGRLQGFLGYAFPGKNRSEEFFPKGISIQQQYKQFGNSVSIPVIEEMAKFMLKCFDVLQTSSS